MADFTVSTDLDTFMQSADKSAMRTNMDLGTASTKDVAATGDAASGEVVLGSDTRLTDARTPTSHTHTLSDVTDSGTAAAKNVPATGDAAAGEVVLGSDTRLTDARTPVSHTHTASEITDFDTEVSNNTDVAANTSKLSGIEAGAEVNNISDANATDLTDGGDSTLHYHSSDRDRANHTGTQTLSTISDAGTIASQDADSVTITGGSITGITDLAVADGGTGSSTASAARTNLDVYSTDEVDAKVATKAVAGGVALDGVNALINSNTELLALSSWSVRAKFKAFSNGNTNIGAAWGCYNSASNQRGIWLLPVNTNTLSFRISTDGINFNNYNVTVTGALNSILDTLTTYDGTTLKLYINGSTTPVFELVTAIFASSAPLVIGSLISGSNYGFDGEYYGLNIFNRALTATEVQDLYETGTVAVADRWGVPGGATGCIADLPLDEGIGYQFHDRSSNHFDALASTSGVTHLVPKQSGKVRVKAADASSAMYMLRADSILPTDSIISNVLSEQCYVDLTNSAQTLDDYRIRLNPSGSDLQIQRSDGSNHATLGTVTAPSSLSDVDVQIHYEQVAQ